MLEEVVRSAVSRAGVVRVRNVLNPFLWGFVWSIVFAVLTYLFRDDAVMKYICLALSATPMLTALGIGVGFAIKAPDRLQSEEFLIRQQELMFYEKGASAQIVDTARVTPRVEHLPRSLNEGGET